MKSKLIFVWVYRYNVMRREEGWLLIAERNFFNWADRYAVAGQQD